MTGNQIQYARLQEDVRHNREQEAYNTRYLASVRRGQDLQYQASIYGSQLNYQAQIYSAQMHYAAATYAADSSRQASMYAADQSRASSQYSADLKYQSERENRQMTEWHYSRQDTTAEYNASVNQYNADTNRINAIFGIFSSTAKAATTLVGLV